MNRFELSGCGILHKNLFVSVNANAEATTLENSSVDVIICAQAFHWFNNDSSIA